jgi:CRP-like cAMP-binding protein
VRCFLEKDKVKIELCTLKEGDYFGEQIYFRKDNRAYFTAKCLDDQTEIGLVPPAEFQSLVKEKMVLQHYTNVAKDEQLLEELVDKIEDDIQWKKTKKHQISVFIKEWLGDPSVDCINWNNKAKLENYGKILSKKK